MQVMDGLATNEKQVAKVEERMDLFLDRQRTLRNDVDELDKKLEVYNRTDNFHQRISDKEQVQQLQETLSEKNQYLKDISEELMGMEQEIENLEHKERTALLNNAEMIVSFLLEPKTPEVQKSNAGVDTHKLNHVKAVIAEKLHEFKLDYPHDSKFIKSGDHNKQKFIRLIENVILKPDGEILQDRLDELYGVFDAWNMDQFKGMPEIVDWLYTYSVFTKDEKMKAIEGIKAQKQISFNKMFKK
jgi:hypothetical protein